MKKFYNLIFLFFISTQVYSQVVIGISRNSFDFYGHDIPSGDDYNFRLQNFDIYTAISESDTEDHIYMSYLKYDLFTDAKKLIVKYNLVEGTTEEIVDEGIDEVTDLDLDFGNNKIYWVDEDLEKVKRANLDGSGVETLGDMNVTLTSWKPALAVDEANQQIYYTEGNASIFRSSMDTWAPEELSSEFFTAGLRLGDVQVDAAGEFIYYTYNLSQEPSSIIKRNISTGEETKIVEGEGTSESFIYLRLFDNRIYWSGIEGTEFNLVNSCDLDGSNRQFEYQSSATISNFTMVSEVDIDVMSGTEQIPHSQIKVNPNPATDIVKVSIAADDFNYQSSDLALTNALGKVVYRQAVNQSDFSLDIANVEAGIYFLVLQDDKGRSWTTKIVKL